MTLYTVLLHREMLLSYVAIEAATPQAATAIAGGIPTEDADNVEDCGGENLYALVDMADDVDCSRSKRVDFAGERARKAASALLAALKAILPYAESEHGALLECWKRDGEPQAEAEAEACGQAIELAIAAIAAAETGGAVPELDIHAVLAQRRQVAGVWSAEDARTVRPDLNLDQAWNVLQASQIGDAIGIDWDILAHHARRLYGDAPETDETGEA